MDDILTIAYCVLSGLMIIAIISALIVEKMYLEDDLQIDLMHKLSDYLMKMKCN